MAAPFVDTAKITVRSGNGGNGVVSFHREKYVANGGPDGGDGGRGGDIVVEVNDHMSTLMDFRYKRKYSAANGADGQGGRKSGRDVDKFQETGLTAIPAQVVKAPLIAECWGHIECKVVKEVDVGVHTMFVGEIVAASANEGCFENSIVLGEEHARMIAFLGGNKYGVIERCETAPMTKE